MAQAVEHVVERELAHASRSEAVGQIGNDVRVVLVDFDKAAYHVLDLLRLAQARRSSFCGRQGFGAAQPVFAEVVEHLVHAHVHFLAVVDECGVRVEVAEFLVERAREVQLDRRDGELVFRGEESVQCPRSRRFSWRVREWKAPKCRLLPRFRTRFPEALLWK